MAWKRLQQEKNGNYHFNGQLYVTSNVQRELSSDEISWIVNDTRKFAREKNGIDYLQVYVDDKGRKLFFIDQLSGLAKKNHAPNENYATLLFAWEY